MPSFEETRVLSCTREDIFNVVMDIEAYPEFLPWVADTKILARSEGELTAEVVANFAGFHHSFKTVDRFLPYKLIEIHLHEGPFRFLESLWSFEDIGNGQCRTHFSIEFEFKNSVLSLMATPIFSSACKSMVQAFEQRVSAVC
ncbi:MAG: type II toxin-antitoxin system RatA family toxin [Mariprofundaceae bacterium]